VGALVDPDLFPDDTKNNNSHCHSRNIIGKANKYIVALNIINLTLHRTYRTKTMSKRSLL
jgi:hypothetical protein